MTNAWNKIKAKFEEDPIMVIVVASGAAIAAAKLIDSTSHARSRRTWEREVARRDRMTP